MQYFPGNKGVIAMAKIRRFLGKCYSSFLWILRDARDFFWKTLFLPVPVKKDKVVFICYNGKNYSCNPKYIAEEIMAQQLPYDMVWLLRKMDQYVPEGIRKVPFYGRKAIYELATAKVIITNTKNDLRIFKKKGQFVIHTWHSSFEPKKLENEASDKLPARYIRESKKNSKQTDLFISNGTAMTEYYRSAFWVTSEILECGYPRNDILFSWDPDIRRQVRAELNIPQDGKIILYAPTFRDDGTCDAFDIDCHGVLKTMAERGGDWYLLIRMHPSISLPKGRFPFDEKILNATPYADMQKLLLAADVLITDYSSTVYEFAVLEKQCYIYASDIEEYQKMRGLNELYFSIPYPICTTNEQLMDQMRQYTPERGKQMAEAFMKGFGGVDKGDASKQVVQRIQSVIEKE